MSRPENIAVNRRRSMKERGEKGLCRDCCEKVVEGKTRCQRHLDAAKEAYRKMVRRLKDESD